MQSRTDRGVPTFGKRRPPDGTGEHASPLRSVERPDPGRSATLLPWALRVSGCVGLLAVVAISQLAHLSDSHLSAPDDEAGRIAQAARFGLTDPETTGAIPSAATAEAARAVQLNPCLVPAKSVPARSGLRP
jgi:hypothetical protein